jgi:hypothetical protein
MVNYELILDDFNKYVDSLCTYIENIADNEDAKNILPVTTTKWGLIKVIAAHVDDAIAIMGVERSARMTAATAIAEARD